MDCFFTNCSPELFIQLFANADYSIVSSFHGTAFSVNFNIPFLSVAPDRFSSRVKSLLSSLGLEERYINNDINVPMSIIDYKDVNNKLYDMIKDTESFLSTVC